ncbi:MAG: hypothetical protein DRP87_02665 [Spirochaetes bacterium]|nr:MAG: hypothetical protein DRP87_02665 [Spirochaetota bacterium]
MFKTSLKYYAMHSRDFVFLPKFLKAKKQNLPKTIARRNLPFSCDRKLRYDKVNYFTGKRLFFFNNYLTKLSLPNNIEQI